MDNADYIKTITALVSLGETQLALDKLLELNEALPFSLIKDITLIKSRFRQLNDDFNIRGLLERKDYISSSTQINYSILEILEKIDTLTKSGKIEYNKSKGKLLHHIPKVMPIGKETRCVVRIAYDEKTLTEDFNLTDDSLIVDVRIAKVMSVELIDFADTRAFNIRTITSDEQFVILDDYSQWIFMVKPLIEGMHSLTLKVAVIEQIDGKDRKREIVLEKEISIISENVDSLQKIERPVFEDSKVRLHYSKPRRKFLPQKGSTLTMIGILFAIAASATVGIFVANKYYFENKTIEQNNWHQDSIRINQDDIVDSLKDVKNNQQFNKILTETPINIQRNKDTNKDQNLYEPNTGERKESDRIDIDTLNKKNIIVNTKSVPTNLIKENKDTKNANLTSSKMVFEVISHYKIKIFFSENAKDSEVYIDGERAEMRNWQGNRIAIFSSSKDLHEILLKKGNEKCLMKNVKIDKEYMEIEPTCPFFRD